MLNSLRWLRDHIPGGDALHIAARDPYYRCLELAFPHGIKTRLPHGCHVRLHPRLLGMRPETYEPEVSAVLDSYLRPGMTVLDIGAHVGLHTLRFSQRAGADGRVLAVEPSPANAALLRKHLSWNKSVNTIVIEAAAGEHNGSTEFAYRPDATDPGGFANSMAYDVDGKHVQVPVTTIDELCGAMTPDVIKIDVEGAELLAIRGARRVLTSYSPVLLIAVHPQLMAAFDTSPAELVSELRGLGYAGSHLDGRLASDPGFEEIIFEKVAAFAGASKTVKV